METIEDLQGVLIRSFDTFIDTIMAGAPKVLVAILIVVVGWAVARVISTVVAKGLKVLRFEKVMSKVNEFPFIKNSEMTIDGIAIIKKFVYWIVLLFFFVMMSDMFGWHSVSGSIRDVLAYVPKLLGAVIILVVGFYICKILRDLIKSALSSLELSSARIISNVVFYFLAVIVSVTALSQAGVSTTVLTPNVMIIIGSIMIAFTISFSIGSREVITNIISSTYGKRKFKVGDRIRIGEHHGTISRIDSIAVTLSSDKSDIILPAKVLINEEIEVFKD